ncbi:DUF899 domain-containing protein [Humisphaera borealis]|uniref:DUF899 domain-containing protein n=1 Tax=Humisphaera borealis TaxID=2807512 RepID=A0A7M2WYZ7_9BACT|nr:thioredoxin family protein [Humisphaera borealis]QOV90071.1 DUF899 domain-containing protein [Humisphaera borealis]
MTTRPIVSKSQWTEARIALLAKEKELTRQRDELARQRRELPWVKVDQNYVFDGPDGKVALGHLFGDRSQLIVYHFMFGPDWAEGCPSCSYVCDHLDGTLSHLAARDVSLVAVSRAPVSKIAAFKKRMGWRFPWVSSHDNAFNYDFHVSFTPEERAKGGVYYNYGTAPFPSEEAPGASVFYKDPGTGEIFHTYSAFSRGLDALLGTYVLLDLTPKGRDEDHLPFSMQWVRHHDRYETRAAFADADKPYWPKVELTLAGTAMSVAAGSGLDCGPSCGCGSEKRK